MPETIDPPQVPRINFDERPPGKTLRAVDLLAFIFSLIGLSIVGLILGIVGFVKAKNHGGRQHTLGIVGIVLGALGFVGWTLLMIGGFSSGFSDGYQHEMKIDSDTSSDATPTVISAVTMGDDFERNQLAAEKKWGGRYVQFTSTVTNINDDGLTFGNVTSQFSFTQISCHVQDDNTVLDLAKGHAATVRGVVGDDQVLGVISLDNCEVVSH